MNSYFYIRRKEEAYIQIEEGVNTKYEENYFNSGFTCYCSLLFYVKGMSI